MRACCESMPPATPFCSRSVRLGSVELSAAGRTIAVNLRGMDVLDPYNFTPDDVSDGTDFFNEVSGGQHAGVLKIRDYEPGSEALPEPEYAAVGGLPAGVSFDPATRALSFDQRGDREGVGDDSDPRDEQRGACGLDGRLRVPGVAPVPRRHAHRPRVPRGGPAGRGPHRRHAAGVGVTCAGLPLRRAHGRGPPTPSPD